MLYRFELEDYNHHGGLCNHVWKFSLAISSEPVFKEYYQSSLITYKVCFVSDQNLCCLSWITFAMGLGLG